MKIDGKKILKDLKKGDRKPVTLYLSEDIYKSFKKACGNVASSQLIEKLMKDFLDSLKNRNKE